MCTENIVYGFSIICGFMDPLGPGSPGKHPLWIKRGGATIYFYPVSYITSYITEFSPENFKVCPQIFHILFILKVQIYPIYQLPVSEEMAGDHHATYILGGTE